MTTGAGTTPTGAQLSYDTEGWLVGWSSVYSVSVRSVA